MVLKIWLIRTKKKKYVTLHSWEDNSKRYAFNNSKNWTGLWKTK